MTEHTLKSFEDELNTLSAECARMGGLTEAQVADAITAVVKRNQELAGAVVVWSQDEDVDEHYNSLFRELLTYMMGDPRTITACAHLLFVAKNLERIGDHATNIAEIIHYQVTGEDMIAPVRPKTDAFLA